MSEAHAHPVEENPFAGEGAVLLDIGGDIGAVVVEMPTEMLGVEIEARPTTGVPDRASQGTPHHHHPHVAVVDRQAPGGRVPSLVFPELRAGSYELVGKGGGPALASATVIGGEVTHLRWPR